MYLTFKVEYLSDLEQVKQEIEQWTSRYSVLYTQKTIKNQHRLAFNRDKDYSLFFMTWDGSDYQIVNIGNERY